MPAPKYQATGTIQSGVGAISPAWPGSHQTNDIALLIVESCGGEPASLTTAAGFAAVTNSPQATGTTTNGTQVTVFWCRATSGAMATPTVGDSGNHTVGIVVTFRGCVTSGNPWDVTAGGVKAAASGSGTATGLTTTVDDCLVVNCIARDISSATGVFSAQANTTLSQITELTGTDVGTVSGNGGGFVMFAGVRSNPGVVAGTTFTVTSSINAYLTIALKGDTTAPTAGPPTKPRPASRVVLREQGTLSDASSWPSRWATSATGGRADVLSNGLRLGLDGLTGGYAETCAAYPVTPNNTGYCRLPVSDWEVSVDVTTSSITDEHYFAISMGDANNGGGVATNGYTAALSPLFSQVFIQRRDGGAQTDLTGPIFAFAINTTYRVLFAKRGPFLGLKVWAAATAVEPAAWTGFASDAKWRGPQYSVFMVGILGGNVAGPTVATFRNLMISTPLTRRPQRLTLIGAG